MMMTGQVTCAAGEAWVLTNVLAQYDMRYVTVTPLPPHGTTVRLMFHAHTKQQGQRLLTILDAAQATLKALHFMGHVCVAETLPPADRCQRCCSG